MTRPVIGIIGNSALLNDSYPTHAGGTMNSCAVSNVAGCIPLIIPADPDYVTVNELLEVCDGRRMVVRAACRHARGGLRKTDPFKLFED